MEDFNLKQSSNDDDEIIIYRLRMSLAVFAITFLLGVFGIMFIEGKNFIDSVYFTVVTMATVGYGDIVPQTEAGRIFVIFFVIISLIAMYYVTTLAFSLLIAGQIKNVFRRKKMEKNISKMQQHIIVCGCGKIGNIIIRSLLKSKAPFVVIDTSEEVYNRLSAQGIPVILGDATADEILEEAQIKSARGIIAALSTDALNLYVALAAKDLQPDVRIVARAERVSAESKFIKAGVERVITPAISGALSITTAMLEPAIYEWFATLLDTADLSVNITQTKICAGSPLIGMKVIDSQLRLKYNVAVLAVKSNEHLISTPECMEKIIHEDDILIMVGAIEQLTKVKNLAQNKAMQIT